MSFKGITNLVQENETPKSHKKDILTITERPRVYKEVSINIQKIIREVKKRENDRYIESASNKSRAIWKIINKESGKTRDDDYDIQLTIGKELVSNPTDITEKLNEFFTNTVVELVKQNTKKGSDTNLHHIIKYSPKSIFILPTTEHEVADLAKMLKGKQSAGYDDIPERIVKQCVHVIKKPLTHIYNTSFMTGVFPDNWKLVKVKPLHKKGDKQNIRNYR